MDIAELFCKEWRNHSRPMYFRLRRKKAYPVAVQNVLKWGSFFGHQNRTVSRKKIGKGKNRVVISTVFLGIDHSHGFSKYPILFETMVFGGLNNLYQQRYRTWNEAARGHRKICKMIMKDFNIRKYR